MTATSVFGSKIDVRAQFAETRARLLRLLGTLNADDWQRPTAAAPWTVRDVAAHVLGDDLRRLSRGRDGHSGDGPRPGESLPEFIHRINDEWVRATALVSPTVISLCSRPRRPRCWRSGSRSISTLSANP